MNIASARIASLPDIPIGWHIAVDNDPSWNTSLSASIHVGSAAFEADTTFFQSFITIEKIVPELTKFDIQLEITTTTDFKNERKILLNKKDLILRRK